MMSSLHDLRYAVRSLIKSRGVTALAILALALGIGANTAIFSVVNTVLLRPLPYHDPGRLVSVLMPDSVSLGSDDYLDVHRQARSFERSAAAELWSASLTGRDAPEEIVGMHVTEDLFPVLGVAPVRGRTFDLSDFAPGRDHVLVIGYGLWQRSFGGEPDIVGKKVLLDGDAYQIVGVMPREFYFAPFWVTQAEMWAPDDLNASATRRGGGSLRMFARLAPSSGESQAQAEMNQLAGAIAAAFPDSNAGMRLVVESLQDKAVGKVRPALEVLLGAVGMVLLIACANVANLALVRATARQKEIAIRLSLGAPRWRIARQFLAESLVLSIAGGALGLLLASWGIHGLQILLRPDTGEWHARLLHWDQLGLDLPVLLFTLAVAVLTGILFGLAPALAASRGLVNDTLKENSRGSTGGGGRLRRILVASEIAIAIVLLIGAGLLMRSFLRLRAVDPGFDARNVVTMTVSVAGRTDYVAASREILYQSVLDRVAAVPGVRQASMTNHVPLAGDEWGFRYWVEGRPLPAFGKETGAVYRSCRPNYFATMRVPILAGRDFTARDTASAPAVVIINETLARREFAKESPIGKRMTFSDPRKNPQWMTIVGVVHDISQDWAEPSAPEIYVPYQQDPRLTTTLKPFAAYMTLVARTDLDAARMLDPIKNAVWSVDRNLPLSHVQTLQHAIGNATWESRFSLLLIGIFSTLAMALAMIGIYGVMAYEVAQRTHEIGIRMALGAARGRILGMIARQSVPVALAGIGVGLAAAAGLVRLMRAMLYQVDVLDPATFAAVGLIVFVVATLAAVIPARSAMKVDPMIALRRE